MAARGPPPHIDHVARARLLAGLARALDAGLPADRALEAVDDVAGDIARRTLEACRRSVAGGAPLAATLRRHGVLVDVDAALAEAGEHGGSLPRVLATVAARYERLHRHARRIRARLMLPLAVLLVGALVQPLPALVRGELDAVGYVLRVATMLAVALLALFAAARLLRGVSGGSVPAWAASVPPLREHARIVTLEQLHALLSAGVAATQAAGVLRRGRPRGLRRAWTESLQSALRRGENVSGAVAAAGLSGDADERALLAAGESAGRLEETLARLLETARARLDQRIDTLAEWLPRLAYVAVLALLASGYL